MRIGVAFSFSPVGPNLIGPLPAIRVGTEPLAIASRTLAGSALPARSRASAITLTESCASTAPVRIWSL